MYSCALCFFEATSPQSACVHVHSQHALEVNNSYCRNGWNVAACLLVVINDILDHVDGIVAKVHKEQYGQIDDPMFGAFIDAFCDKVENILSTQEFRILQDILLTFMIIT